MEESRVQISQLPNPKPQPIVLSDRQQSVLEKMARRAALVLSS